MTSDIRHDYERLVRDLERRAAEMRAAGAGDETIARALHAERRTLAHTFKERTPEPLRARLYQRTAAVYGDRIGPTIEYLIRQGKSWTQIIESASRPGPSPTVAAPPIERRLE